MFKRAFFRNSAILVMLLLVLPSCEKPLKPFLNPYVDSKIITFGENDFLIIYAAGGSATNTVYDPRETFDKGVLQLEFSNKVSSLPIVDPQPLSYNVGLPSTGIIYSVRLDQDINRVEYLEKDRWVPIWTRKQTYD